MKLFAVNNFVYSIKDKEAKELRKKLDEADNCQRPEITDEFFRNKEPKFVIDDQTLI